MKRLVVLGAVAFLWSTLAWGLAGERTWEQELRYRRSRTGRLMGLAAELFAWRFR